MPDDRELPAHPVPRSATLRTRLNAAATRATLGVITGHLGTGRSGIWLSRTMIAVLMGMAGRMPSGTAVEPVDDAGVVGEWVYGPGVDRTGPRALYLLHGSGYVLCSPRTHRSFAARLSQHTGLPCFVVDYRLAPENRFPAASDDVVAGWRWLLTQGYGPADLVIAGDSAGGHLGAALALNLAADGEPGPACTVLFSPVVDVTFALAAQQERRRRDPLITAAAARDLLDLYTRDAAAHDRWIDIDYSAAAEASPMLVQAGGAEMLSADARHLVAQLRAHGGTAELEIWPGQMHVFQALPRLGTDADAALRHVRAFVRGAFARPQTRLQGETR